MASRGRDTTQRDKDRASISKGRPPCAICGQPIDYRLRYPDPGSFTADHIIPLSKGGPDTLANKQAAHRKCNRDKSDREDGGRIIRRSGSLIGL